MFQMWSSAQVVEYVVHELSKIMDGNPARFAAQPSELASDSGASTSAASLTLPDPQASGVRLFPTNVRLSNLLLRVSTSSSQHRS
jgi:hypothetical protein